MENYKVGQIIFMTSDKSLNILPVQIVEEVIRTTIGGKEKTYMIKLPDKNETIVDIKQVTGSLFKTKNEIKKYMLVNAENAIIDTLARADELKDKIFINYSAKEENNPTKKAKPNKGKVDKNGDNGVLTVDLGGGKKANMNVDELNKIAAG